MSSTAGNMPSQIFKGVVCQGHYFEVPLDYADPTGQKIKIFAREAVAPRNAARVDLPWLVWLSGGPGFEAPRPEGADGWLKRALQSYRVLLLDQRGTGLSSPITHESLTEFAAAAELADYVKHFRADNIVRDCEFIRNTLGGGKPWTILGQSYGGFCSTAYLSQAPEGLSGALIAGGLPPLVDDPDEVYRATYQQVIQKNILFYERFPYQIETVRAIVDHLGATDVRLPTGETLSPRRFLQLGLYLGFTASGRGLNALNYLLERAFLTASPGLSYKFLRSFEQLFEFNTNPLYAILQEAIYCQNAASRWSAERIMLEFPQFTQAHSPVFFTGEMIYSWMFDEYQCLKPLKEATMLLSEYSSWPLLYDVETLRKNTVPCVAAVYVDDMYVDLDLSRKTAAQIGAMQLWITNEYEHDAIRVDGERLLDRMLGMLHNER